MAEDKAALVDKIQNHVIRGEWNKAVGELRKLNALLNGQDLRVRLRLAEALSRTGKKEEAIEEYLQVANSYAEKCLTVQAIAVNKLIVKLDPSREDVHKKLAESQGNRCFGLGIGQRDQAATRAMETARKAVIPKTPLLPDLTVDELAYLSQKLNTLQAPAGSTLFKEEDPGDSIFIVTYGEIKILSKNSRGEEVEVTRLREGDFFGEFAYFSNSKRQASAVASVDAELLEMTREMLADVTEKMPRVKEVLLRFYKHRVVDKLMALSQLFRTLDPKVRLETLQKLSYQTFNPGELIVEEGCPGDYLYLIKSGKADITTRRDGKDMHLATIGEGEFFGEMSLMTEAPKIASVRAKTAMEIMRLSKADLDEVVSRHPQVKEVIDAIMKKRVEDNIRTLLDLKMVSETGLV